MTKQPLYIFPIYLNNTAPEFIMIIYTLTNTAEK